jgi:hypothetical protein
MFGHVHLPLLPAGDPARPIGRPILCSRDAILNKHAADRLVYLVTDAKLHGRTQVELSRYEWSLYWRAVAHPHSGFGKSWESAGRISFEYDSVEFLCEPEQPPVRDDHILCLEAAGMI